MTGQCKAGLLVKYEVKAYQYEPKASHLLLLCRFLQLLPAGHGSRLATATAAAACGRMRHAYCMA